MATVASQLTRIHDVEGTLTLTSVGGGQGASANADIVLQANQSVARRQSNATDHGYFLTVGSQDISAANIHVGVWVLHAHYTVITKLQVRLGSATTAWEGHSFPVTNYPLTGGWVRVWINVGRTADESAGTFNKSALTQVGLVASLPAVAGTAVNIFMDASDFTTGGLLLTGTNGLWLDFLTADESNGTNKYGIVTSKDGVIYCLGRLTLGSLSSSLVFNDSNFVIIFPNQSLVASTFMGLTVDLQHASTLVEWANAVIRSAGNTKGDLVVTGTSGAFNISNSTLSNLRIITLTSASSLGECSIAGCGLITAAGAEISSCSIINSTASVALFWNVNINTNGKLDDTSFTSVGSGHAIELGPNTPDVIALFGVEFNGYGLDDTTDATIYNNSGKFIEISILGNGSVPTIFNGSGASTDVITGQRNLSFDIVDTSGSAITGYEWRLYESSGIPGILGTVELAGEESSTMSEQNFAYTYTGDLSVVLQIIHNNYIESIIRFSLIDADRDINIVLVSEENI